MRHLDGSTRFSLVALIIFAVPAILSAQPVSPDSTGLVADTAQAAVVRTTSPAPVTGAPLTGLRAGVHVRAARQPATPTVALSSHANLGTSRAMMVVGVAGLIVGAIIGGTPGTIIMVGGAVVGLKGLYDYMQ